MSIYNIFFTVEDKSGCGLSLPKLSDILEDFKVVIKERPDLRRPMLIILVFNFACYIFAYNGQEGTHRYYYTGLVKF